MSDDAACADVAMARLNAMARTSPNDSNLFAFLLFIFTILSFQKGPLSRFIYFLPEENFTICLPPSQLFFVHFHHPNLNCI